MAFPKKMRSREAGNAKANDFNWLPFPFLAFPTKLGTAQVIDFIEITGFLPFPYYVCRWKGVWERPFHLKTKSRTAAYLQSGAQS